MSKKYKILESGRIQALRSLGSVNKGDIGGFVYSEVNLSHEGDCWVSGNAEVFGDAKVFGNAKVSGNAEVFGGDIVTKSVLTMQLLKDNITVTDNHVNIGCEQHTLEYWLKNYKKIGLANGYTEDEIEGYKSILYTLTHFVGEG